jgi:hypothetical protein
LVAEINQNISAQSGSAIQQVGYVTETKTAEAEKTKVSTIPLNGDMTRRLIEVKPSATL